MQPGSPFQITGALGYCQVGKVWAAVDGQGRQLTVAVLEPAVAADRRWRDAFAATANSLAQPAAGGQQYLYADFTASAPWVAYAVSNGPGAERIFQALGMNYRSAASDPIAEKTMAIQDPLGEKTMTIPAVRPTTPPAAQSGAQAAVPVARVDSGAVPPRQPWEAGPPQPVSAPPQPVSSPPVSAPPQPVSAPPQAMPESGVPAWAPPQQPETPRPVSSVPVSPSQVAPSSPSWAPQFGEPESAAEQVSPAPESAENPFSPFSSPAPRIEPVEVPQRRSTAWVGSTMLVVLALGIASVVFAIVNLNPGSTGRNAPTYSVEERALAVASPSLVFIETLTAGYLRDQDSGTFLQSSPIVFNRRCSGFIVSSQGHVLTNGSCVKPPERLARERALHTFGQSLVAKKELSSNELDNWVKSKMATTVFTGADSTSEPESQVYAQLNVATGTLTESPAIPGQIVQVLDVQSGDLAVIKLEQENLPAVELSTSTTLDSGASLFIAGYENSGDNVTYIPRTKSVKVIGEANQDSVSVYRLSDDVGFSSHGGMAIDTSGRIVGVLDNDPTRSDYANRAVVPLSVVTALLEQAGVTNSLGESDKLYREALDDYFNGRYSDAIAKFDEVVKSSPENLAAQDYRQQAADRRETEGEPSGTPVWLTWLLAGVGGAMAVGFVVIGVNLIRNRGSRS